MNVCGWRLEAEYQMFIASNLKRSAPPTSYMVVGPQTYSEAIL